MRPLTRASSAALVSGVSLIGAATVAAAPPSDDDGSAAALEQFVELAEEEGYTIIDPACSASPRSGSDLTFTCYAMTSEGAPLIARTTLSEADVVEFEILVFVVVLVVLVVHPAFGRRGELEVHLVPAIEVDFLDLAVRPLDADDFLVRIDGQDLERFLGVKVLVPLSGLRFVIAAHGGNPRALPPSWRARGWHPL